MGRAPLIKGHQDAPRSPLGAGVVDAADRVIGIGRLQPLAGERRMVEAQEQVDVIAGPDLQPCLGFLYPPPPRRRQPRPHLVTVAQLTKTVGVEPLETEATLNEGQARRERMVEALPE